MDLQPLGRTSDFEGFPASDGQLHALTWRGFQSTQAEEVYRRHHLGRDRFHGTLFLGALAVLNLTGIVTDFVALNKASVFIVHVVLRLLVLGSLAYGGWWLARPLTPRRFDRLLAAILVLTIGATLFFIRRDRMTLVESASTIMALVGLIAFILPASWYVKGLAASALTLGYLFHSLVALEAEHLIVAIGAMVLNVLGLLAAYEAGRWQRLRFMTLANEVRRREELEALLAKVKNLQEILPICAHCRCIRDQSGRWHSLDRYFRDFAGVRFSHGICSDCLRIHHPEQFDTR